MLVSVRVIADSNSVAKRAYYVDDVVDTPVSQNSTINGAGKE